MDATFLYIVIAIMLLIVIAFLTAFAIAFYRQTGEKTKVYIMTVNENGYIKVKRYRGSGKAVIDKVEKW